jgi:hypothetical protein
LRGGEEGEGERKEGRKEGREGRMKEKEFRKKQRKIFPSFKFEFSQILNF